MVEQKKPILSEPAQFGRFFSDYRERYVRIAYSYVYQMDVARDIVTDSFLYVWERREELDSEVNLKGYVYLCVRNRCISWLRERSMRTRVEDELSRHAELKRRAALDSLSDDTSDRLFAKEVSDIFREELLRMPALTRAVFEASRNEQMTYKDIALQYGISVRRVTAEIQYALQRLRLSLKDYLA